eukprot:CAMPEP_0194397832 /NCGR_PEP_ID=MMETSP0174-20130528/125764_1 /TAXON_ID=216777 /ORGANISM="Proboscia alata, Strain PI-D3" /LENGTH=88 /DNA_ID=CAMNT_0039194055 /DNA_START=22 /DNA_END=288 /DNA_ORIENTATION=-
MSWKFLASGKVKRMSFEWGGLSGCDEEGGGGVVTCGGGGLFEERKVLRAGECSQSGGANARVWVWEHVVREGMVRQINVVERVHHHIE